MKFEIKLSEQAEIDLKAHAKAGNKRQLKKIYTIFQELQEHPRTGTGKPEQLKHGFSGYWSRRVDEKNRIIYQINNKIITVTVVSAKGHYSDK